MSVQFHPLADIFPLLDGAELENLAKDISQHGLQEPVALYDGKILDGRNRYRACILVGVEPRFETYEGDNPRAYVISLNLKRRHLNELQRAMIAARLANMPTHRPTDKSANLQTSQSSAAELLNVSPRLVASAAVVIEHAEPEIIKAVDNGFLAVSAAAAASAVEPEIQREAAELAVKGEAKPARTAIKKAMRAKREEALAAKQRALPDRRYGVILADPEWEFECYSEKGKTATSADNHYPCSSTEVIMRRNVPDIAADDCVLFLWSTVPKHIDALRVMEAWGFEYKSHVIWNKDRTGTGYWFVNKHELLLVGTKGKIVPPCQGTLWPSVIDAPRGKHSEKPEVFLEMIESYYRSLPKIELNRRGPSRTGWDCWGLEAEDGAKSETAA